MCLLLRQAQSFAMRIFALLYFCVQSVYGPGSPLPVVAFPAVVDLPRFVSALLEGRGVPKQAETSSGVLFFDVGSS